MTATTEFVVPRSMPMIFSSATAVLLSKRPSGLWPGGPRRVVPMVPVAGATGRDWTVF
jgi:hypothetical protein